METSILCLAQLPVLKFDFTGSAEQFTAGQIALSCIHMVFR